MKSSQKHALFDLHCDTAYEMFVRQENLSDNDLSVSLRETENFDPYVQVMAFWTAKELSDEEGWNRFLQMRENLLSDEAVRTGKVNVCVNAPFPPHGTSLLFSIEDARIFAGKEERVKTAYDLGIRILTPLWRGISCIGGAYDTNVGLSPFGKKVVERSLSLGMIPDISHASIHSSWEIMELAERAGRPAIASHSDAWDVCHAKRNLYSGEIAEILRLDGVIGINLHSAFLRETGEADLSDVLRQITYFAERGAEKHLCFGCDFDGGEPPKELSRLSALSDLYETLLAEGFSESFVKDVFFENANRFANQYLKNSQS